MPTETLAHPSTNGAAAGVLIPPSVDPGRAFQRGVENTLTSIAERRRAVEGQRAELDAKLAALTREQRAVEAALRAFQRTWQPGAASTALAPATRPAGAAPTIVERARTYAAAHDGLVDLAGFCAELVAEGRYRNADKARGSVSSILRKMPGVQSSGDGTHRLAAEES